MQLDRMNRTDRISRIGRIFKTFLEAAIFLIQTYILSILLILSRNHPD